MSTLEKFARAYDREDASQRGEPDPWIDGADDAEWVSERLACAHVALAAIAPPASDTALVGRLKLWSDPVEYERHMTHWDSWRAYIKKGGGASWPRDAFESLLDAFAQDGAEAAARLTAMQAELEAARAEIARCHERLEIDHHFVLGEGEELVRVEVPYAERSHEIDGIECRDATIKLLESDLAEARAACRKMGREAGLADASADRAESTIARAGEPVAWCQPMENGEHQPRTFMVYYEDQSVGVAVFDNEADAREHWEQANRNWNCYLFGAMPLRPALASPSDREVVAVTDEMVKAYKAAFDEYIKRWSSGALPEAQAEIGKLATRSGLTAAIALSAPGMVWLDDPESERICDETAMRQWEASLKRPDLAEKDRVRGAIEAFKRQAIALSVLAASPSQTKGSEHG